MTRATLVRSLRSLSVLALVAGCASKQSLPAPRAALPSEVRLGSSTTLKHPRKEIVTESDLSLDGRTDLWTYRVSPPDGAANKGDRLVRKELDINGDGRIDVIRYYDSGERLEREAVDLDFDGKIDQLNHYRDEVIQLKERDFDGDGQADEWRTYEQGRLVRTESARDREPKPDGGGSEAAPASSAPAP